MKRRSEIDKMLEVRWRAAKSGELDFEILSEARQSTNKTFRLIRVVRESFLRIGKQHGNDGPCSL